MAHLSHFSTKPWDPRSTTNPRHAFLPNRSHKTCSGKGHFGFCLGDKWDVPQQRHNYYCGPASPGKPFGPGYPVIPVGPLMPGGPGGPLSPGIFAGKGTGPSSPGTPRKPRVWKKKVFFLFFKKNKLQLWWWIRKHFFVTVFKKYYGTCGSSVSFGTGRSPLTL